METANDRVKILRKKYLGMTQEKFAEPLLCKRTAISNVENHINSLSKRTAIEICNTYKVNYEWLMTGKGEIFNTMVNTSI